LAAPPLMEADGVEPVQQAFLSRVEEVCGPRRPSRSRYKPRRLAIYNDLEPGSGRLFVLNPDGSDITVLAEDVLVFGFDWSPDGSRIAFTEDQGAELPLFVAPADGSTVSLVAEDVGHGPASHPVWSPDGTQIAIGRQNAFLTADAENIVIDADGSGDAAPLDDLTYESWRGGSYDCDCDIFG
jgi:WD40 repeat protein